MTVDKTTLTTGFPVISSVVQAENGTKTDASVENANNVYLLGRLIDIFNYCIDQTAQIAVASVYTALQSFGAGIKTDSIGTYTTGGDLTITNTGSGTTKIADATYAAGRVLTTTNINALYGTGGATDMTGANGSVGGVHGLAPAPAATDNVKFLRGDATWATPTTTVTTGLAIEGRLTVTPGTAITTSDVTAATTVYFTPYNGSRIALHDGSSTWTTIVFAETSIAVPGTTSTMYDLFGYSNSGTLALEALAWTNDTTRATALTLQNGVWVKTGATTRRYLGSFRTTTVSGQTEDSAANRLVWSIVDVARIVACQISTASWNYTTNTLRAVNASTTAGSTRFNFIRGLNEKPLSVTAESVFTINSGFATAVVKTAIGLDIIIINAGYLQGFVSAYGSDTASPGNVGSNLIAKYLAYPTVGYHFMQQLEAVSMSSISGSPSVTFIGGSLNTGMTGIIYG